MTIAEYKPLLQRDPDIESAFDRVTNEWLGQKKSSCWPSRWARPDWKNPMDKRYFYAKNAEGTIVAFIAFVRFSEKTATWPMLPATAAMLQAVSWKPSFTKPFRPSARRASTMEALA